MFPVGRVHAAVTTRAGVGSWIVGTLIVVVLAIVLGWAAWWGSQPVVRVEWDRFADTTRFAPVPADSVRVQASLIEPGCVPVRVLARLYVRGRLIGPSDRAVTRAMRRAAGAIGASAIAPTVPSMNDLPVLGWLERMFADVEADDRLRHTEEQAGRAVAVRCPESEGGPPTSG
jgi:hypothetical protein